MDCGRGPKIQKFTNCLFLRNHQLCAEDLWTRDSQIVDPDQLPEEQKGLAAHQIIDCGGAIISPGFIDVQINGGFGANFAFQVDKVDDTLDRVGRGILAHGVTSFCPTVVSRLATVYHEVLPHLRKKAGGCHGAEILGAHAEGPFISFGKRGAHVSETIQNLHQGMKGVRETYKHLDCIAIVTLAPELDHAAAICKELSNLGVVVSLGHSMAGVADGERAVQNGASFITHLYNGMQMFQNRDPGLLGLLASDEIPENAKLFYGLIADGHHSHASAVRMAYRTHPSGIVLVTDACSALGLPDGVHQIAEQSIEVQGTRAVLAGTDTLVGGCASMISCIKYFWKATNCTLAQALEAATLHPAQLMKIQKQKGTLDFGSQADLVILESNQLNVLSTWIAGQCVYNSMEVT